jgi:phospholipid/cholesterol/gamma-HCH transport system ATP-binding protein
MNTKNKITLNKVCQSLKIVDYVYFISEGVIAAEGTPSEVRESVSPFVHQFIHSEVDGPVPFHYPAEKYATDLNLENRIA